MISPLVESKQIQLQYDVAENLSMIQGNRDRLIQLLLIFLDNAVKYTPSGGTVSLSLQQTKPGGVNCVIQDNGIGIPEEDLPYIWERFYKVDQSHQQNDQGTGLGLAIARQILDLHKAQFHLTSVLNEGTRIELEFQTTPSS